MTQTTTRALSADVQTHGNAGDIIPSVPVERIVAQRNRGVTAFLEGVALIREAQTTLAEASGRSWFAGLSQIVESSLCSDRSEQRNAAIRRRICRIADRDIWTRLMNETGMFTLMSEAQRKQWDTQLYSDDCPEITPDNVIATFRALNASKGATFEQGVIDVFRNLSWDYKTNTPCLLGKRIIIDGVLDNHRGLYFSVRTYAQSRINDLARPFWILDGKNVPDFRVSEGAGLSEFISRGGANSVGDVFTCEYFTVRAYKKGSAHITFTRPDLVEKVNDIIARHYPGALPPKV
ncbi:DUF4942 domain-containing protein [Enterobacter bugandensis]|uniref:DUF4942 domain-containing protein n=1 Tax=Enterobacter bugandensis TaxID=881260 RepID=A0AA42PVC0_9ENTR|nr:DUF4942 domain-containing protein [Enterobacter bugandensis]MDH1321454.1 DUF4942 domain-containing protein [Enterobacter bugandensis]